MFGFQGLRSRFRRLLLGDIDGQILHLKRAILDLKIINSHQSSLNTEVFGVEAVGKVADESWDYKQPRGTLVDDTRCPQFVRAVERYFNRKVSFCDLGCAGGGLVFDFIISGNQAIGIEGSNLSKNSGRAHWAVIPSALFVADITKPLSVRVKSGDSPAKFDVISAWEVMEHIPENLLPGLFKNIRDHLADGGLFVCSIATFPDFDPVTGAVWHVTLKDRNWWVSKFSQGGFDQLDESPFVISDYARGSGNFYAEDWDVRSNPEMGFHLVMRAR